MGKPVNQPMQGRNGYCPRCRCGEVIVVLKRAWCVAGPGTSLPACGWSGHLSKLLGRG